MTSENHHDSGSTPTSRSGGEPRAAVTYSSGPPPVDPVPRSPALQYQQYQRIALVDLLDRLLAGGVVISGDIRLSIADVDLVTISLRALIASVSSALAYGPAEEEGSS